VGVEERDQSVGLALGQVQVASVVEEQTVAVEAQVDGVGMKPIAALVPMGGIGQVAKGCAGGRSTRVLATILPKAQPKGTE
jgi:hypothetical protein